MNGGNGWEIAGLVMLVAAIGVILWYYRSRD